MREAKETKETKRNKIRNRKLKWAIALLGLLGIFALWWNGQRNYHLPEELAGEWKSSDPRYADRLFELSPGYVSFGTGDGTATTGFIREVKVTQEAGKTLYTITYRDDDGLNQLFLYYDSSHGETIRLKNQPNVVWTRASGN